jgi:hypothetical protein
MLELRGVGHLTCYGDCHGEIGCSDATAGRVVAGCNHHHARPSARTSRAGVQRTTCHSTAYRHKKRIEELGPWEPLSTRPKSRPDHQTPPEVEGEILGARVPLGLVGCQWGDEDLVGAFSLLGDLSLLAAPLLAVVCSTWESMVTTAGRRPGSSSSLLRLRVTKLGQPDDQGVGFALPALSL